MREERMKGNLMLKIMTGFLVCTLLLNCKPPEQQEVVAEQTFGAAAVKVYEVKRQKISEKLFYTGLIEARKKIVINPDIGGKIDKIYVEAGDRVQAGQILAELDTRAIRLQLEQAQAQMAVSEASHKDAQLNLERWERLRKESAVSDQQYEQVKLAFEAAESQLAQARATVNLAKYNLDVSIMEAPFPGIIASRNADVGDVINPMMGGFGAASGVMTLMDFSVVKIMIELSQKDVTRIQKGQDASLAIAAYPDKLFHGKVMVVNQAADSLSKKFKVEVYIDNAELMLKPNTFGDVVLEVSSHAEALVIPQAAVLQNNHVFVVEGDKAVKRDIRIGLQNADLLEVLEGLKPGDLVVIEGNFGLEDGAELDVKEVIQ
jgi:RND family efflux transporter MFP subunit